MNAISMIAQNPTSINITWTPKNFRVSKSPAYGTLQLNLLVGLIGYQSNQSFTL